eukprot:20314-Heterococcus_DN1.PRE.3
MSSPYTLERRRVEKISSLLNNKTTKGVCDACLARMRCSLQGSYVGTVQVHRSDNSCESAVSR